MENFLKIIRYKKIHFFHLFCFVLNIFVWPTRVKIFLLSNLTIYISICINIYIFLKSITHSKQVSLTTFQKWLMKIKYNNVILFWFFFKICYSAKYCVLDTSELKVMHLKCWPTALPFLSKREFLWALLSALYIYCFFALNHILATPQNEINWPLQRWGFVTQKKTKNIVA